MSTTAAAGARGEWTSLNGRATDSVLLHCPETKEDCDWPSEDRRRRRRRLAAARDRPPGQGRPQPSSTAGRAVRPARAGRPAGPGRPARRRWREKGEERRDGLRTGERPLREKPMKCERHADRIGKESKEENGVEFLFVIIVSFSANYDPSGRPLPGKEGQGQVDYEIPPNEKTPSAPSKSFFRCIQITEENERGRLSRGRLLRIHPVFFDVIARGHT